METITDSISDLIKVGGILFALFHFLVGFVMYRDMIRINKVIRTRYSRFFLLLSNIYLIILLVILVVFILI